MQPFAGEYRLSAAGGGAPESGPCDVVVEGAGIEVTPRGGASIPVRFAEVRGWLAASYRLELELEDGSRLELSRLGRRLDELVRAFGDVRREHFSAALLLEEAGDRALETGAYSSYDTAGAPVAGGAASVHLQRTSLACFPEVERPFLVPYGSILAVERDDAAYGLALALDDGSRLVLSRFGLRTDALGRGLEERRGALARRQGEALAALAPDLGAVALRRGAGELRDGVPVSRDALERAAPGLWDALWEVGFDEARRPYAELLRGRAKLALVAMKETTPREGGEGAPAALRDRRLLYLFEVDRGLVVEAPSADDAATYVFRAVGEGAVEPRALCRALAAVQFRREPVYLPATALRAPPHDRYAEAARLVPQLVAARRAFTGRAIHASLESWRAELDAALARAGD